MYFVWYLLGQEFKEEINIKVCCGLNLNYSHTSIVILMQFIFISSKTTNLEKRKEHVLSQFI